MKNKEKDIVKVIGRIEQKTERDGNEERKRERIGRKREELVEKWENW